MAKHGGIKKFDFLFIFIRKMADLKWILIKHISIFDDWYLLAHYYLYGFNNKNIIYALASCDRCYFSRNKEMDIRAEEFENISGWIQIHRNSGRHLDIMVDSLAKRIKNNHDTYKYAEDLDIDLYSLLEGVLLDSFNSSDSYYIEIKYSHSIAKIIDQPCKISDPKLSQIAVDFFNSKI